VPGVAVFSRRALPLAAWTNGLEIAGACVCAGVCWCVLREVGVVCRDVQQEGAAAGCMDQRPGGCRCVDTGSTTGEYKHSAAACVLGKGGPFWGGVFWGGGRCHQRNGFQWEQFGGVEHLATASFGLGCSLEVTTVHVWVWVHV
jgi:hypothetical protein